MSHRCNGEFGFPCYREKGHGGAHWSRPDIEPAVTAGEVTYCVKNTDPPPVRCSWCGGRLRWESGGYWLRCPVLGHPSHHDPRVKGLWWRLRVAVGR